jgi:hypothetical protein
VFSWPLLAYPATAGVTAKVAKLKEIASQIFDCHGGTETQKLKLQFCELLNFIFYQLTGGIWV